MRLRDIPLSVDRSIAASPAWIRLVDTFTGRPPIDLVGRIKTGSVRIKLERTDGGQWQAAAVPITAKSTGDIAFVNLGRVRQGRAGEQHDYRCTVAVDGTVTETINREPSVEFTVTTWSADAPPPLPPIDEIRCYPAPDYQYPPGVALASGTVVRAGNPVGRARVRARETVAGRALIEDVRTDEAGSFRLPLRWSAGATRIDADSDGASGSRNINVPADLGSAIRITIS